MSDHPIDLRSDTLTQPSDGMRRAMAQAELGDDVYGEDPTLNRLERRTAELLGHEAGLYCPTGSMTNMLGIATLVPHGTEVLCDALAHIARNELGGHAAWFGVTMRTWISEDGLPDLDLLARLATPAAGPYLVSTAAIALENTHNATGGRVQPLTEIKAVRRFTEAEGIYLHLDGARLWNAHIATGVPLAKYGSLFDSVSVCFSKGLGAPVGSVLLGSADQIARARVLRKRLGGGMRQAGVLAAACEYALDHQLSRLEADHAAATAFAEGVAEYRPSAVPLAPETNIVRMDTGPRPAAEVAAAAAERGVLVGDMGRSVLRAVTHLGVSTEQSAAAGRVVGQVLSGE